jgi:small subunit ribosomal protein S12e
VNAGGLDIPSALRSVLRESLYVDGLARGIDESARALDKKLGKLCVLAKDCEEATYKKLVEALCKEHEVPLVKVDDKKALGEMAGLCKIDKDGKARKVVQCSCVVVQNFGKDTPGKDYLFSQLKKTEENVIEQEDS